MFETAFDLLLVFESSASHPFIPTSPANAGAQIHPERLGLTRPSCALKG
jgi:hypothetical protein